MKNLFKRKWEKKKTFQAAKAAEAVTCLIFIRSIHSMTYGTDIDIWHKIFGALFYIFLYSYFHCTINEICMCRLRFI